MKQALLPCGTLILVLVSICVRGSSAFSNRKLFDTASSLVDELNELRQRLVATTGFSEPQWVTRKLQQDYNPYPASSYYGGYGYGYGYYYGGYYAGDMSGGHDYMMMRRRSLLSTAGSAGHVRQLKQAYPYPYGYGGYYGYGYYYGYGAYPPAADPYAMMEMSAGRRRMMGSVEHLADMLTDETDGFVDPANVQMEVPRRDLKAMAYDWPSANYGYSYGYGYYYGGYGGYATPYMW